MTKSLHDPLNRVLWRIQSASEKSVTLIPYVDRNIISAILDSVVGQLNWKSSVEILDQYTAKVRIEIKTEDGEWISREDVGQHDPNSQFKFPTKSAVSDGYKRVGNLLGILRSDYANVVIVDQSQKNAKGDWVLADHNGKILWTGNDVDEYVNKVLSKMEKDFHQKGDIVLYSKDIKRAFTQNSQTDNKADNANGQTTNKVDKPLQQKPNDGDPTPPPTKDEMSKEDIVRKAVDALSNATTIQKVEEISKWMGEKGFSGYGRVKDAIKSAKERLTPVPS